MPPGFDRLLFGPSGVAHSAAKQDTLSGIERVAELGLDCMELAFVQRVSMGPDKAAQVKAAAERHNVRLTVHAPYYINLNSPEPQKILDSKSRMLQAARVGAACGAESVCIHAAFYMGVDADTVYQRVKAGFGEVVEALKREGVDVWMRPEVMGKPAQFGTVSETVRLSREVSGVLPLIDFAHLHARSGGAFNTHEEFCAVLEEVKTGLGAAALERLHLHVSGIEYGPSGEKHHLNLEDSDFKYRHLLRALKEYRCRGFVICESPNQEDDALLLKRAYEAL
ncbi:MAG TPA: TIM barrel protein [Candidatus Bipolaricaulota bacterium]